MDIFCFVRAWCSVAYSLSFIILAIKLDDRGVIFIVQERVGKNGGIIYTRKFRTMQRNEINLGLGANSDSRMK